MFVDDEELLHIILDGLPSDYDSFSSTIRTRSDVLSVAIHPLIATIIWILHVKEGMPLLNLLLWWPMLLKFRLPIPSLLTQAAQIM